MDNLEFYKNEVKLFNYVGPTVIKNRQDDFKYQFLYISLKNYFLYSFEKLFYIF